MKRILLIVAVGVLARAIMLVLFDPWPTMMLGDVPLFMAQSQFPLRHGFEPPGYPLFLSLIPLGAVIPAQMTLTLGGAVLTYVRTRLLWLALAIAACPFLIIYELRIYTETIVCQLVWIALLLLCWPKRRWEPVLAGTLLGLAALTRDTLYLMPLLLPLLAIRTRLFKPALIACLAAFLTVLPCQLAYGPKISEGRGGFALWIGTWETNPDWQLGGVENWPVEAPELHAALARHDDKPFADAATDAMRSKPLAVVETWAIRYPRLWLGTRTDAIQMRVEKGGPAWFALKLAFFMLNLAILALALAGAWRLRNDPRARLLAAPAIYLGLILIPFHNTEPRYSLPALIPLLWFAGHAMPFTLKRWVPWKWDSSPFVASR